MDNPSSGRRAEEGKTEASMKPSLHDPAIECEELKLGPSPKAVRGSHFPKTGEFTPNVSTHSTVVNRAAY